MANNSLCLESVSWLNSEFDFCGKEFHVLLFKLYRTEASKVGCINSHKISIPSRVVNNYIYIADFDGRFP